MFAAIYARKSTEQKGVDDEQKSVARQVEHARAFAGRQGWDVDEACIFVDDGISGAEFANRPGLVRLMNVVDDGRKRRRPAFQILIVSDLDRVGREQLETGYVLKQLSIGGVRVFTYLDEREILLDSPTATFLMQAQSFGASLEREKARQRTHDAMIRKARAGHVTGGRVFGYDNVDVMTDELDASGRAKRSHVARRINEAEAAIVRRIFQLCAEGYGKARTARTLNEEGAPAPRAQRRRPMGWCASSVYEILYRPLYRGEIVWNQTRKRDTWGAHHQHARAKTEHLHVPAPGLRIVSDDLWTAAHARLEESRALYLRSTKGQLWGRPLNAVEAKYLLSGLAECGTCHGTLEVRSRTHGRRRAYFYQCSTHRRKGPAICRGVDVPMARADAAILDVFEADILSPSRLQRAMARAIAGTPAPAERAIRHVSLGGRLTAIESELRRLTDDVASGAGDFRAVREAIAVREAERARIDRELARTAADSRPANPDAIARVLERMQADWRGLLRKHPAQARQMLRKLLQGRLVFAAEEQHEQPGYRVRGTASVEPLLNVVLNGAGAQPVASRLARDLQKMGGTEVCAQAVASPAGNPELCTSLDLWFPRAA